MSNQLTNCYDSCAGGSSALQLVLVALVGGTVMAVTAGPMMGQIEEGFGTLGELTTSTTLNISEEATFSAAADYVYHRASNDGCRNPDETGKTTVQDRINDGAYQELEGTFLTSSPPCVATDDSEGGDQEGTLSRVQFVIDETSEGIKIQSGGQEWLGERIRGASPKDYYEATNEECGQNALEAGANAAVVGAVIGSTSPDPITTISGASIGFVSGVAVDAAAGARFVGTKDKFVVYFRQGDASERTNAVLDSDNGFGGAIYCYPFTDEVMNLDLSEGEMLESPLDNQNEDFGSYSIDLCPGDRGYIQTNKDKPQNDGEAGENIFGWANKYSHIVITETGQGSCDPD